MTPGSADDPIVAFYGGGTDHRGRTLAQILAWPDESLEMVHDYIQWVFPTAAPSGVNRHAPLVSDATRAAFAARPELRDALSQSLERMLSFYGLHRDLLSGVPRIVPDQQTFADRAADWLWPGDHNHLRLTRILHSLAALGLTADAAALQRCLLTDIAGAAGRGRVTVETIRYWREALPGGGDNPAPASR